MNIIVSITRIAPKAAAIWFWTFWWELLLKWIVLAIGIGLVVWAITLSARAISSWLFQPTSRRPI